MAHFVAGDTRNNVLIMIMMDYMGEPMTQRQIVYVSFGLNLIGYFDTLIAIDDLEKNAYIAAVPSNMGQGYVLTCKACDILQDFAQQIPLSTRKALENYIDENRVNIINTEQYHSSRRSRRDGTIDVQLSVADRDKILLCVVVNVLDGETASAIQRNWEAAASEVYRTVLLKLTSPEA